MSLLPPLEAPLGDALPPLEPDEDDPEDEDEPDDEDDGSDPELERADAVLADVPLGSADTVPVSGPGPRGTTRV